MRIMKTVFMSGLLCLTTACSAGIPESKPVDAAYLASQHIPSSGTLVAARMIRDQDGEHILQLNRQAGPSPSAPKSGRIEHIELTAVYYAKQAGGWKQEWTVRDVADCPELDAAADFFISSVAVTDINGDGKAEITIPYKLFCGGGIDSYTVKVILREGPLKLAIRGESEVRLPGQPPFGGDHKYDKALLTPAYAAYKNHLDQIWKTVSVDIRK
ncbi:hypothetical protein GW587_24660 [Duganella sp. SAP-35]|uniref:Lipoprotein n=2 Tax=Duganella aceris TaxID=2703883 RepID=A0ABX0FS10_9BURK|nr:hypothetical protein [Duganella aceris]